jgi:hypothetical protein
MLPHKNITKLFYSYIRIFFISQHGPDIYFEIFILKKLIIKENVMSKKNVLKLVLDFCMIIVLVLMYNKSSVNLSFHEIGGLALIGVMLIHVLINGKWVTVVTKKLFDKTLPVKTKLGYILNVLLLISFLLIGISGIMISEVLFHISVDGGISWKTIHYTSAAVALILIGIHIGLHKQFICNHLGKLLHIPKLTGRIAGIALSIIIVAYGCFSFTTTSFANWLLMPFSSQQSGEGFRDGGRPNHGEGFDQSQMPGRPGGKDDSSSDSTAVPSGIPSDGTSSDSNDNGGPGTSDALPSAPEDGSTAPSGMPEAPSDSDSNGGFTKGMPSGDFPDSFEGGKGIPGGSGQSGGILNALKTIAQFFSIAYVFAAVTALLEMLILKLTKKNIPSSVDNTGAASKPPESVVETTEHTNENDTK